MPRLSRAKPGHLRVPGLLIAGGLLATALACGRAGIPTPSAAQRATGLAQTAAVLLTSTAAAGFTPASATPPPTATPLPTTSSTATVPAATPVPATPTVMPTPCTNDSAFVTDVNVLDGTHFAPGAAFTKTWRLRNDGVCTWTTAYTFRRVSGESFGAASVNLLNEVPPGATVDLAVPMTAPGSNGTFTGEWQLHDPAGEAFGTKPYVQILVP